jgi:hypothetical protein
MIEVELRVESATAAGRSTMHTRILVEAVPRVGEMIEHEKGRFKVTSVEHLIDRMPLLRIVASEVVDATAREVKLEGF